MVEAADRAGVATDDLPRLRARLAAQVLTLAAAATRIGGALPALLPTPTEIASAGTALGDLSATAVAGAVDTMNVTLDSVDATLQDPARTGRPAAGASGQSTAPAPPVPVPAQAVPTPPPAGPTPQPAPPPPPAATRSVMLRNGAVYGAYSAAVLVVQALLFLLLDESRQLPSAAPLCLLVLPAMAWAAGYLTIGVVFRAGPDGKLKRTPRFGAIVCLIPDALLFVWVGVLFLVNL
jgi:hypothetical protein